MGIIAKKFTYITFLFTLILLIFASNVSAITNSEVVELQVPDTTVSISGKAAPSALVSIKENNAVIASVIADSVGNFNTQISRNPGVHEFVISYTDKNDLLSTLNKNSISLQPQQDTPYNVFLSPTIQLGSQSVVRRGSLVQIRGYSIAGSLVNISLDYGKTLFQTTTNAEGYYEYFIDTTQLLEGEHTITTNTIKGADLSDSSRVITFSVQTEEENFIPDIVVGPDKLPPPIVIAPEDGSTITGDTIVITGDATPGAQINVYENGKLISTVNTDKFGDWSFQYTARFSPVSLSFEACIDGRCSILSRDITLFFTGIASRCNEQFGLEEYRFWNIASNETVNLNLINNLEGVLKIEWGDETYEKFSKDLNGETNLSHIYRSPSTYNGTIIFEKNDCTYTKFFSVIVSNDSSDNSFWYLLIFVASLFLGSYLAYKDRSKEK